MFRMPPRWGQPPWGRSLLGRSPAVEPRASRRDGRASPTAPQLWSRWLNHPATPHWWSATGFGVSVRKCAKMALPYAAWRVGCSVKGDGRWCRLAHWLTPWPCPHQGTASAFSARKTILPRVLELCKWRALNSSWLSFSGFQHDISYHIQWDKF